MLTVNEYLNKMKMKEEKLFEGIEIFGSQTRTRSMEGDIRLVKSYVSISQRGLKKLGLTLGDYISTAIVAQTDIDKRLVLIGKSNSTRGVKLINKPKVSQNNAVAFTSFAKSKNIDSQEFYLKPYGYQKSVDIHWFQCIPVSEIDKIDNYQEPQSDGRI